MKTINVVAIKRNGLTITTQASSFDEVEGIIRNWVGDSFYNDSRNYGEIVKVFAGAFDGGGILFEFEAGKYREVL